MATADSVYNTTTVQQNRNKRWFNVPTETLSKKRCVIKMVEVLLSCVAFVVEEVVSSCSSCGPLYFFEFISCTAFLFTLLLLILLTTKLHLRVGITCWPTVDFVYTVIVGLLFLLASVVFAADNSDSGLEKTAVAFGFLATIVFFLDAGVFYKEKGNPFQKRVTQPADGSNQPTPESEKLNSNGSNQI